MVKVLVPPPKFYRFNLPFNLFFMRWLLLLLIPLNIFAQDCTILSKANDILPSGFCSPVSVDWNVRYRGVNNAGTPVSIRFDWDNGITIVVPATNTGPGEWEATASNTYDSDGDKCNYRPKATLIVNGVVCTSSTQEQIVTVWDNDDSNGGVLRIVRPVHPLCVGTGGNIRFRDQSRFNCVPPQERDVPNLGTRWVQWIYGTDITMTGELPTIGGLPVTFPYAGPIIVLPGPVAASNVWSQFINVLPDKLVGQYFQVTLKNWNYCNPYDDPTIPGPPADPINGDHPPVITTAIILIVPLPDPSIEPIDTLCLDSQPWTLRAATPGGSWSGPGVSGGLFYPSLAGVGTHVIEYSVTSSDGCTASDFREVVVMPLPEASISPAGPFYSNDPGEFLTASPPGGDWSGPGIGETGFFSPSDAGVGLHTILYRTLPDSYGCRGIASIAIEVLPIPPPVAGFLPDTTGCSPLLVQFRNESQFGEVFIWSFGDGIFSSERDPEHLYAVPGTYTVTLTAYNSSGTSSSTSTIRVLRSPRAAFDIYPEEITRRGQTVVFYNLSQYSSSWMWDFGDGSGSQEEQPNHVYTENGIYSIRLIVESSDGCVDSLIKPTGVFVNFSDGYIVFPSAFRWNRSGPTGGWWQEGLIDNTVFRPWFENVERYELVIYNRWGEFLYSSLDIMKGWDGYLRDGSLALEGVYVWKVWVKYINGVSETHVGDVTFFH